MKKSTKPLKLNKITISNLSSSEMDEMIGGVAPKPKTYVLTCQPSCNPTIHPTLSYLPCPKKP